MADKKFIGKRANLGVYDDACNFTDEEKKTYKDMLARDSFDTGINIFDGGLWAHGDDSVEYIVPPSMSNAYCIPATNIVSGYIQGDTIEIKMDNNLSKDQLKIIEDQIIEILKDKY